AYATLDSTQTLAKAFKPSGFLARFVDFSAEEDEGQTEERDTANADGFSGGIPGHFSPQVRYNRVDEFFGGLKYNFRLTDKLELRPKGGYSTGPQMFSYGGGVRYLFPDGRFTQKVGVEYIAENTQRYHSEIYSPTLVSIINLLGYPNYFDYFRREGIQAFVEVTDHETDLSIQLGFNSAEHSSLET